MATHARRELMNLLGVLCAASLAVLVPILFLLLFSLDKIVTSARSLILGKSFDQSIVAQSEVCQLAQNVQDSKKVINSVHQAGLSS